LDHALGYGIHDPGLQEHGHTRFPHWHGLPEPLRRTALRHRVQEQILQQSLDLLRCQVPFEQVTARMTGDEFAAMRGVREQIVLFANPVALTIVAAVRSDRYFPEHHGPSSPEPTSRPGLHGRPSPARSGTARGDLAGVRAPTRLPGDSARRSR